MTQIIASLPFAETSTSGLAQLQNNDNNVIHIVGRFQHWLDMLGLKIPRALCGVSLEGDPARMRMRRRLRSDLLGEEPQA
jgi:hypothetical protein